MKKSKFIWLLVLLILWVFNGCASVGDESAEDIPSGQTEAVSVSVSSGIKVEDTTTLIPTEQTETVSTLSSSTSMSQSPETSTEATAAPIQKEQVEGGKTVLHISDSKNTHNLNGFSAEWDPQIFRRWNTDDLTSMDPMFNPVNDWSLFQKRIKAMGIQRSRVWIQPEWFANGAGIYDFTDDNEAVLAVTKQLDLAQEMGMRINLTIWCADRSSWLGYSNAKDWCSAPNDKEAYADITCRVLQEFLVDRGYSCIQELTLFNEPSWAYYTANGQVDFSDYEAMVRIVNQRLTETGLRDKIRLVVSDDAEHTGWYQQSVSALSDIADLYSSHTYAYSLNTPNAVISDWVGGRTSYSLKNGGDKPFLVDEFGTNNVIPPMKATDVYTYERGLFLAKFVINALDQGAAGASYWCMYNQNYGDHNMMEVGLWGFADEAYTVRPTYHAWGIINHYTAVDSEIYAMTSDDSEEVIGVALKAPNGRWSYIIANLTGEEQTYSIVSSHNQQSCYKKVLYTASAVTASDEMIAPTQYAEVSGDTLTGSLPANSFAIYYGDI